MSDPRLNERTNERTQKGGTKGKKAKPNITKKSNPILKFNRTSEIQRRLGIERKRRRHEEALKKLKKTNRNRIHEHHLEFIKYTIKSNRQKERNRGDKTDSENQSSKHSSRNSTEYSYSNPSSKPNKPSSKPSSKSSKSSNHPVRPTNRNAFHELRQRMQEAASRETASRKSNAKVNAPKSWRNYLREKIGW